MQGLFDTQPFKIFDFKDDYVGYVLDNSEFSTTYKVRVFIPELFGYSYYDNLRVDGTRTTFSKSHILNSDDVLITTAISSCNYVYAKILLERHFIKNGSDEFLIDAMPDVGDKVIVQFFNGNPQNCYFTNTWFISDSEKIVFDETTTSTNTTTAGSITVVSNTTEEDETTE